MSTRKTVVFTTLADVGAAGLEDGPDVLQHPLGLLGDPAVHQLAGGGIEADLAGGEQEAAGARCAWL